jgi:uncharacterized membrane protein
MDFDLVLRLVFRWLHILPAVILLGGVFFMRLALSPAVAAYGDEDRRRLYDSLRGRWAKWVMISAGLLLVSGIINTVLIIKAEEAPPPGLYHGLLTLKIILALAIIYIASLLAGRSEAAERFRQKAPFWLNLNVVLAIILILVGGGMRLTPRVERGQSDGDVSAVSGAGVNR